MDFPVDAAIDLNRIALVQETLRVQKARRSSNPPRKPHSSIGFVEEKFDTDDTRHEEANHASDEESSNFCQKGAGSIRVQLRKANFSLRSMDSVGSLLSMASAASGTSCSHHSYEVDDDSESTVEDDFDEAASFDSYDSNNQGDRCPTSSASSTNTTIVEELQTLNLDEEHCEIVCSTWENLCKQENAEEIRTEDDDYRDFLGEQIMLRMMHVDPRSRSALGISSFRSPRYGKLCHLLVDTTEQLVLGVITACRQQHLMQNKNHIQNTSKLLQSLADGLTKEGFDLRLLKEAILFGIQSSVSPRVWTAEVQQAFRQTFLPLLETMCCGRKD